MQDVSDWDSIVSANECLDAGSPAYAQVHALIAIARSLAGINDHLKWQYERQGAEL